MDGPDLAEQNNLLNLSGGVCPDLTCRTPTLVVSLLACGGGQHTSYPVSLSTAEPTPTRSSQPAAPVSRYANLGKPALAAILSAIVVITGYGFWATTNPPSGTSGWLVWTGQITGIGAALMSLFGILLSARVPLVENTIGHIHALKWHSRIGKATLVALVVHIGAIIAGYTIGAGQTLLDTTTSIVLGTPWMLQATLAALLFGLAGFTSYRMARERLRYETWWALHLYFYLAVALGFGHQIVDGAMFANHPLYRGWWIWLYLAVGASVLGWRIIRPIWTSLAADLHVSEIVKESDDIITIYIAGNNLSRFKTKGGQFFRWRFLSGRLGWHALPLSLSNQPDDQRWRLTVAIRGDHTRMLSRVPAGTRIIAEGPYGHFTADQTSNNQVVAFVSGVGAAPVRSLCEDLPAGTHLHVIHRISTPQHRLFAGEWEQVADLRGINITVDELSGSRDEWTAQRIIDQAQIDHADIYICAPDELVISLSEQLHRRGVPGRRIHTEVFNL